MTLRRTVTSLAVFGFALMVIGSVRADNCGSLADCFGTIEGALGAAIATGLLGSLISMGLDMIPGVGTVKGILEGITGKDIITGEKLSWGQRALGLVPLGAGLLKGLGRLARVGISEASHSRNLLNRVRCFFTGHPVDVATGKVYTEAQDFSLPGPIPFSLERVWFSTSTYNGPLGYGWHHCYDLAILAEPDGVAVRLADGRGVLFPAIAAGGRAFDRRERLSLLQDEQGYALQTAERLIYRFSPVGRPNGEHALSAIEDFNGNRIQFEHDPQGRLNLIIDSANRILEFELDSEGRIATLIAPHPTEATRRIPVAAYEYNQLGELASVTDAAGKSCHYAYENHLLVKEADRAGFSFYFDYEGQDENAWCVRSWGDGNLYDRAFTYDKEKQTTIVADSRGARTIYHWNELGLVTHIEDAAGGVTKYDWNAWGEKLSETDPNGNAAYWQYDDSGNVVKAIDPLGHETRHEHNDLGLQTQLVDRSGNSWKRRYDDRGNLIATIDAAGNRWEYQVDRGGRLLRMVNPLGHSFKLEYGDGNQTIKSWDGQGNLTVTHTDFWERPLSVTDPLGRITRLEFDLLNRVVGMVLPDGARMTLLYDAEGNLLETRRNGRMEKQFRYAGFHRLVERIDAEGQRQQFQYDSEENLVAVTNEKNEESQLTYNLLNRVTQELTFDRRVIRLEYDAGSRRTQYIENSGNSLTYRYDAAGNIIEKAWSDGQTERFEYDPEGRVLAAENDFHRIEFVRDAWGRVIRESRDGRTIESAYDAAGLRTLRRDPWQEETAFGYDKNGDLKSILFPNGQSLSFERNGAGDEVRRLLADGSELRSEYGPLGELRARELCRPQQALPISAWRFDYNDQHEVVSIDSTRWGRRAYGYDAVGRLIEHQTGEKKEVYNYDPAGNPSSSAGTVVQVRSGNQLGQFNGVLCGYDADGRLTTKSWKGESGDIKWSYRYQADGRLKEATGPAGETIAFEYDPFGRRITKRAGNLETRFWWDEDELLGEEADGRKRQYWYSHGFWRDQWDMEPVAIDDPAGFGVCLCDHAGTPREIYSSEGEVLWSGDLAPWGSITASHGQSSLNPLRFPGQYCDSETALHYNRFRYYDPALGRYITPDPAGLAGGLNEYAYGVNPISWIDPFGLAPFEQSHSFARYLLRAIRNAGAAFTGGSRIPGQSTVRLGRNVHRAFHEAFDTLLPEAARHRGAAKIATDIMNGTVTPKQIGDALEQAARQSIRRGSSELANTLSEIKRLRKCGGF